MSNYLIAAGVTALYGAIALGGGLIGYFKAGVSIGAGDDQLLGLHLIAEAERLEIAAAAQGNLADLVDDFCRGILGRKRCHGHDKSSHQKERARSPLERRAPEHMNLYRT